MALLILSFFHFFIGFVRNYHTFVRKPHAMCTEPPLIFAELRTSCAVLIVWSKILTNYPQKVALFFTECSFARKYALIFDFVIRLCFS